jgi:D-serine deaminase-like pyridoxal phosphate-dependent protein
MQLSDIETPAAVIDLDRLEANISSLQRYLDQHGIANRPHIKTHKIPAIAQMQLDAGAAGITCQKLGEAEVMADAGISTIFLPYNLIGAAKLARLTALRRRIDISVTADSAEVINGYAAAMQAAGLTLDVLVECDTGGGRCGVQTPQQAAELAALIAAQPALRFGGLMTYPLGPQTQDFLASAQFELGRRGLRAARISVGSTPLMWHAHETPAMTEFRAGTYVFGDRYIINSGAMTADQCAMHVLATVVSRPTATRAILDCGSKTLSSDLLGLSGYGEILEYPQARIVSLSEEHGTVDLSGCERTPQIGERVSVLPNHCCVVSNLFNRLIGVRNGMVETIWPVAARGLLQ